MEINETNINKLLNLKKELLVESFESKEFQIIGLEKEKIVIFLEKEGKKAFKRQMNGVLIEKKTKSGTEKILPYLKLLESYHTEEKKSAKPSGKYISFGRKSNFLALLAEIKSIFEKEIVILPKQTVFLIGWKYFCENNQCSFPLPLPKSLHLFDLSNNLDEIEIEWRFKNELNIFNTLFSNLEKIHKVLILSSHFIIGFCADHIRKQKKSYLLFRSELLQLRFEYYKIVYNLLSLYGYIANSEPHEEKIETILDYYNLIYDRIRSQKNLEPEIKEIISNRIYIEPPFIC